jgi:hypothetical protein
MSNRGETTPRVYLAEGQDVRGRLRYRPACKPGCPLSGDSTAILDTMTWPTSSASKAVGTGRAALASDLIGDGLHAPGEFGG